MRNISDAFSKLDPAKQEQIRKAALREFAREGYERASTNNIVKEAGIAKGTLFYYFRNKQALFDYLVKYVINYVETEYLERVDFSDPDFLARYWKAAQIKLESYLCDKEAFEFLGAMYLRQENQTLLQQLDALYQDAMGRMLSDLNTSLFRTDITVEYAMKIATWAMEGYQSELQARLQGQDLSTLNMKPYWDEFSEFLQVLRILLYKKQGEVENDNFASQSGN
ncbi:MAG: TetR/AcrR family transcriptional regulator [Limnochordia bacterium]|nr:TetR/AcrR family transcriptional regulator [Bacillota bacterium]